MILEEVKVIAQDIKQNLEQNNPSWQTSKMPSKKGCCSTAEAVMVKKSLTNINALADEFFKMAYHGLRAKDKTFNASLKTDFDASIGKVNYGRTGYWKGHTVI